ncbi:MAG: HYR domain-containing protein [Acidobacteria bacterium]|nr:HYR domain-containing protein [Acidobacteriota bacterium]
MKRKLFTRTLLLACTSLLVLITVFQLADRWAEKPSLAAGKAPAVQSVERFSLNVARRGHTMTALPDGRVVIIGGENETGAVAEAEILDSAAASLTIGSRSITARSRHTATLIDDGRVLVIGGTMQNKLLNSTEWFDPATQKFSAGPRLNSGRAGHTATELADGRLLVAGGNAEGNAEIFDPSTGRFTLLRAKLGSKPSFHSAALLADGKVLLAGGVAQDGHWLRSALLFDPATMNFAPVAETMWIKRIQPAMRLLPDGKMQVIGGDYDGTMEVYDPARNSFRGAAHLLPTADIFPAANVMTAQTHKALIDGLNPPGAKEKNASGKSMLAHSKEVEKSINALDNSLDRLDYAMTEIAVRNQTVVAGGVTKDGQLTKSVVVLASSKAELTTDKVEYQQGETPQLSGTGWQPDESVQIVRQNARPGHKRQIFNVVADQFGNLRMSLPIANYADGMTYTLTAMGELSGRVAQTVYSEARNTTRAPQGPDKVAYSYPLSFRNGSVETDAGIWIWEIASGGPQEPVRPPNSPFLAPNVGFSQTFTFDAVVDRPCLGIPGAGLPCPFPGSIDMRLRSGSSLTVGGSIDGDISVTGLTASASVSENLSANLLFDVTANGTIDLPTIPIPGAGVSFKAGLGGSGIEASLTFGIVAKPSLSFTAPGTQFLVGFNFSQNATLGAKVSTSGITPISDVQAPSFSPTFQVTSTNGGCLALDIGPEISIGANVSCLVGDIGLNVGTGLFAFGEACLVFDRSDPNCQARDITFDVGSRGYVKATANLCLTSVDAINVPFELARFRLPLTGFRTILSDALPPTVTPSGDLTVPTAPGQCSASVTYSLPAVSDNCSGVKAGSLNCSPSPGAVFAKGVTTVNCSASDNFNNIGRASFRVNVVDTEKPVLQGCVGNITKTTDPGQCSAVTNFTLPQATDNCAGVTVSSSILSGTAFPKGVTTVTVTATDAAGNQSTCSFTVTVVDTEAPAVTCPANIVQSTDPGLCSAVVRFNPTATDNCPGVTVATSIPSGAVFPKGTTTVTATATDAAGNKTSCSFTVTVVDTELPVLGACPTNITQSTDPGLCSAVVRFTLPTATDNCPGVVVTSTQPSGAVFPKGVTTVTVTATDTSGNKTACSFTVTVVDTEAPVIGPAWPSPPILADPDGTMRNVRINYDVTDNCPGVLNNLSVSANELDKGTDDPGTPLWGHDWQIISDHQVRLRAERTQHGLGRIYFITIGSTDEAGNKAVTKKVSVKVPRLP